LSSVSSKLDKENALRLQLLFASDMQTGPSASNVTASDGKLEDST